MKILICGKGGSGKSTVVALLAKSLNRKGLRVLLVDADESNVGVSRLLGSPDGVSLLDSLGGKKDLQKKMMAAFPAGKPLELFTTRWSLGDIPADCLSQAAGIQLMSVGKIQHFGEGCACPMGALAKAFFSNLDTAADEVVVIDAEAGVEHFGRGVEAGCDLILAVVDPSYESILLALPVFPIIILLAAYYSPAVHWLGMFMGLLGWGPCARIVRSQSLSLTEWSFVQGARA
jgi:CO dehydrogenase maturation factor